MRSAFPLVTIYLIEIIKDEHRDLAIMTLIMLFVHNREMRQNTDPTKISDSLNSTLYNGIVCIH